MPNQRKLRYWSLLLFIMPLLTFGQGRKYSNEFLNIGVDARGLAMSGSVIASATDVTAGYWNPAGLVGVEDSWQIGAMHSEYFADIAQFDYLAYAQPLDQYSSFGVSLVRFGVDGILNTTRLIDENGNVDYDRITEFSSADYALIGTYARRAKNVPGLSYGGNFKIIYRHVGKFANAIGFGFDVGLHYERAGWLFGANLRDVTTTFNSWNINTDELGPIFDLTDNELPEENLELTLPRLLLGVGRNFRLGENYELHAEVNGDFSFGGQQNTLVSSQFANISPGLGMELAYKKFLFLRAGAGNVTRVRDFNDNESFTLQPNMGLGLKFKGISIDYALTNIGSVSDVLYSNIFSLKFDLAEFKG